MNIPVFGYSSYNSHLRGTKTNLKHPVPSYSTDSVRFSGNKGLNFGMAVAKDNNGDARIQAEISNPTDPKTVWGVEPLQTVLNDFVRGGLFRRNRVLSDALAATLSKLCEDGAPSEKIYEQLRRVVMDHYSMEQLVEYIADDKEGGLKHFLQP